MDEKKKAPKRPTIEIDVTCIHCKSCLHIKAYKNRISEPVTPEYAVTVEVELGRQGMLPGVQTPALKATGEASKPADKKPELLKTCRPVEKKRRRAAAG